MLKITKEMEMQSPYYHLNLGLQLQKESRMLLGRSLQLKIIFEEYDLTYLGKQWLETASLYAQLVEVYEDEARKEFDVVDNWIKMKYDEIGY